MAQVSGGRSDMRNGRDPHTHTRTHAHTHTRTRAHTHTRTHARRRQSTQYKASMARMTRDPQEQLPTSSTAAKADDLGGLVGLIAPHAKFIMMPLVPVLWCVLAVTVLDREMLLSAWFMPFLGIFSGTTRP